MSSEPVAEPMAPVSPDEFRHACGRFATGVTIASVVDAGGAPHGLTVSSFTSLSLEPPLILICLGHESTIIEAFRNCRFFGVNILREEDRPFAERFATRGLDRFDAIEWRCGKTGVPLLPNALAIIECGSYQRFIAGDHDILVGQVVRTCVQEGAPLLHYAGQYRKLG